MRRLLASVLFGATLLRAVVSLSCYICGDANLDEFGECATQFQYDCGSYASRFAPTERIYCRTTRHRAKNNTYTVMKECISERDHYKSFPQKSYPLDEECDLIDINGEEVAYCLCRHDSLCNQRPIADQFMAFEEKHPELFAEVDKDADPSSSQERAESLDLTGRAFAAPNLTPNAGQQPIQPVNDPRFAPAPEVEVRRSQLPTRPVPDLEGATERMGARPAPSDGPSIFSMPKQGISAGEFIFATDGNGNRMSPPKSAAPLPSRPISPSSPSPSPSSRLRCLQCGQGQLPSEDSDCQRQIAVDCPDQDAFCFTRQILLAPGQAAVEKMCVSREALVNEYGEDVPVNGCVAANGDKVRFCVCAGAECNRESISRQRALLTRSPPPPHPVAAPPPAAPIAPSVARPNPLSEPEDSDMLGDRRPVNSIVPAAVNGVPVQQLPAIAIAPSPSAPSRPAPAPAPASPAHSAPKPVQTAPPVPVNVANGRPRCSVCTENEMADPTADCGRQTVTSCGAGRQYCLTRQTQLASGVFNMEKKCVTPAQFSEYFPDEKLEVGCATAFDGLVNYCVCEGDMCNREGLLQQAQGAVLSPESPAEEDKVAAPVEPTNNSPRIKPVVLESENSREGERQEVDTNRVEARISAEEREMMERQRQWRDEQERYSSASSTWMVAAILLPLIF